MSILNKKELQELKAITAYIAVSYELKLKFNIDRDFKDACFVIGQIDRDFFQLLLDYEESKWADKQQSEQLFLLIKEKVENFKLPDGFESAYPHLKLSFDSIKISDVKKFEKKLSNRELQFSAIEGFPKLPINDCGLCWSIGWDIPTVWMIDGDNQCWADYAHGYSMNKISQDGLIYRFETEQEQNQIRKILGLEIPMPSWAKIALSNGWSPPENWTWNK